MKYYISIEGDTNDGDLIESLNEISYVDLEKIKPVVEAVIAKKDYNWSTNEYSKGKNPYELYVESGIVTEEEYEIFYEFVPHGEYGIHSITSIKIFEVTRVTKLL